MYLACDFNRLPSSQTPRVSQIIWREVLGLKKTATISLISYKMQLAGVKILYQFFPHLRQNLKLLLFLILVWEYRVQFCSLMDTALIIINIQGKHVNLFLVKCHPTAFSSLVSGSGTKYWYNRFPSNIRTGEQEEKRKQILAAASGALEFSGIHTPRYMKLSSILRSRLLLNMSVQFACFRFNFYCFFNQVTFGACWQRP